MQEILNERAVVEMSFLLSELLLLIAIITYFVDVINPI
jgi:hypothetical protein